MTANVSSPRSRSSPHERNRRIPAAHARHRRVERLAARVAELGRPVDVLAANAGVGEGGDFAHGDLRAHLRLIDLNVRSAVQLTGLYLRGMLERDDGAVLFTSSIAATMPGPYASTYDASKSFLLSFAEANVEVKDSGVAVTALMPGPTDTNFFERAGIEDTKLGQSKKDDPRDRATAAMHGKMSEPGSGN